MTTKDVQVSVNLTELRRELTGFFSLEELRTLCSDLGVDYESLSGEGKAAKVRELVNHCERKVQILDLLEAYYRAKPTRRSNVADSLGSQAIWIRWVIVGTVLLLGILISFFFFNPLSPISLVEFPTVMPLPTVTPGADGFVMESIPSASLVGLSYVTNDFDPRVVNLRTAYTDGIPVQEGEALRLFAPTVLVPEDAPGFRVAIEVYADDERIGFTQPKSMDAVLVEWDNLTLENYIDGTYSQPDYPDHWRVRADWEELDVRVVIYEGAEVIASNHTPVRLQADGHAWLFEPPNLHLISLVYSINDGQPVIVDMRTAFEEGLGVAPGDALTIQEMWYKSNDERNGYVVEAEAFLTSGEFDYETDRQTASTVIDAGIQRLPDVSSLMWVVPPDRESLAIWLVRSEGGKGSIMDSWYIPLAAQGTPGLLPRDESLTWPFEEYQYIDFESTTDLEEWIHLDGARVMELSDAQAFTGDHSAAIVATAEGETGFVEWEHDFRAEVIVGQVYWPSQEGIRVAYAQACAWRCVSIPLERDRWNTFVMDFSELSLDDQSLVTTELPGIWIQGQIVGLNEENPYTFYLDGIQLYPVSLP